jgi:hypothetical protein
VWSAGTGRLIGKVEVDVGECRLALHPGGALFPNAGGRLRLWRLPA